MSSILDALKKLEQQNDDKGQDVTWPQPVDTKGAMLSRLTDRPSRKPVAFGLVLGLALGLTLYMVMSRAPRAEAPSGKAPALARVEPPAPRTRPRVEPPPAPTRPQRPAAHPDGPALAKPAAAPEPVETARPDVPARRPSAWKPLTTEALFPKPEEKTPEPVEETLPQIPIPSDDTEQEADPVLDEEMVELLERIPKELLPPQKVVESGWLTLQAISWSDEPARRIAVINSQIVKEGRRIDGAVISRIERDYVVIEKNGEELMLPFGNH